MTREEFEYAIKSCGCFIYRGQTYYEESELIKAFEDLDLIHIGLEQEPSGDLISRQAVHEAITRWAGSMSVLIALPTREVRPLLESIHKLPSVKPQENTGHWKMMYEPENMVVCSECGKCAYLYNGRTSTWCPHCGNYKGAKNDT